MPHARSDSPPKRPGRKTRVEYVSPPNTAPPHDEPPRRPPPTYGPGRISKPSTTSDEILRYGAGPLNLVTQQGKQLLPILRQPAPPALPPLLPPIFAPPAAGEHQPLPPGPGGQINAGVDQTPFLPSPQDIAHAAASPIIGALAPPLAGISNAADIAQNPGLLLHPLALEQHIAGRAAAQGPPFSPIVQTIHDAISDKSPNAPGSTTPTEHLPPDVQARLAFDREVILDARRRALADPRTRAQPLPGAEVLEPRERQFLDRILLGPKPPPAPKPKPVAARGAQAGRRPTPVPIAAVSPDRVAEGAAFLQTQGLLGLMDPSAKRALSGVLLHYAQSEPDKLRGLLPGFAQTNVLDPQLKAWLLALAHSYHVDVSPNENEAQLMLDVTAAAKGHPSYASELVGNIPSSIANLAIGTPAFAFAAGSAMQDLASGDTTSTQQLLKGLSNYYGKILSDPTGQLKRDPAGTALALAPGFKHAGDIAGRSLGLERGAETITGPPSSTAVVPDIPDVVPPVRGEQIQQTITRQRSRNVITRPVQVAIDAASRGPRRNAQGQATGRVARATAATIGRVAPEGLGAMGLKVGPEGLVYKGQPVLWNLRMKGPGRKLAGQRAAGTEQTLATVFDRLIQAEPSRALTMLAQFNDALFRMDPGVALRYYEDRLHEYETVNRTRGPGEPASSLQNRRGGSDEALAQLQQQVDHYRSYVKLQEQLDGDPETYAALRSSYGAELDRQVINQEILLGHMMGWTTYQRIARAYGPRAIVRSSNLASDIEQGLPPEPMGPRKPGPTPEGGVPNATSVDQRPQLDPERVTELPTAPESLTPAEAQARQDEAQQQAEIAAQRQARPVQSESPPSPDVAPEAAAAKPKRKPPAPKPRKAERVLPESKPKRLDSFDEPTSVEGRDFPTEREATKHLADKYGRTPAGAPKVSVPHVSHVGKDRWLLSNWREGARQFPSREAAMKERARMLKEGPPPEKPPPAPKPEPVAEKPREAPAAPQQPVEAPQAPRTPEAAKPKEPTHAELVASHQAEVAPAVAKIERFLGNNEEIRRAAEYLHHEHHRVGGMHSSPYARRQVQQKLEDVLGKGGGYGFDQLLRRGQRAVTAGQWESRIRETAQRELDRLKRAPKMRADQVIASRDSAARMAAERAAADEAFAALPTDPEVLLKRWNDLQAEKEADIGSSATWQRAGREQQLIERKLGKNSAQIQQDARVAAAERIQLPYGEARILPGNEQVAAKLRQRSEKPVKPQARAVSRLAKAKATTPAAKIVEHAFNALQDARVAREAGNMKAEADVIDGIAELLGTNPKAVRDLLAAPEVGSQLTPTEIEKRIAEPKDRPKGYSGRQLLTALEEGRTPEPADRVAWVMATGRPAPKTLDEAKSQMPSGGAPKEGEEPPLGAEAGWRDSFYPDEPRVPPDAPYVPDELVAAAQTLNDGSPSINLTHYDDPRQIDALFLKFNEAYLHAAVVEGKNPESTAMVKLDNKRQLALATTRAQLLGLKPKDMLQRRTDAKGRLRYEPVPHRPGEPLYIPLVRSRRENDFTDATGVEQPITTDPHRLVAGRGRQFKGTRVARGDFEHNPEAVYGAIAQTYRVHHHTALVRAMVALQGVTAMPGTMFDPRRWVVLNVGEPAKRGLSKTMGRRSLANQVESNEGLQRAIADYEDRVYDPQQHLDKPDPASLEMVRLIYHQRDSFSPARGRSGQVYAHMPEGDFVMLPRPVHDLLLKEAAGSTIKLGRLMKNWQSVTKDWRTATLYARPAWLVFNMVGNQGNVVLAGATVETLRGVARATANVAFRGLGRPPKKGVPVPAGVTFQGFAAQHFPRLGREGKVEGGDFGSRHRMKRFAEARSMRELLDPTLWPNTVAETVGLYTTLLRDVNVAVENAQRRTIARAQMRRIAKGELGGEAKVWLSRVTKGWAETQRDIARHMGDIALDPVAADHVLGTVNDFLGNFSHGVPHPYADLLYPFWRWTAFITRLGFHTLPVHYPGRASLLATASNLGAQASAQQGSVPERLAGALPIAGPAKDRLVAKISSLWPLATLASYTYSRPGEGPGGGGILSGFNPAFDVASQVIAGQQFPTGALTDQGGNPVGLQSKNPVNILRTTVNALERSVPLVSAVEGRGLAATNTIFDTLGQAAGVPGVREQLDPRQFQQAFGGRQPTYTGILRWANYMGLPLEEVNYDAYNRRTIKALADSVSTSLRNRARRELRGKSQAEINAWWQKHTIPSATTPYWRHLVEHPDELARMITHGANN